MQWSWKYHVSFSYRTRPNCAVSLTATCTLQHLFYRFLQLASIESCYTSAIGGTIDEIAKYWGRMNPFEGVEEQHHDLIRQATMNNDQPTLQTFFCFVFDSGSPMSGSELVSSFGLLVNKERDAVERIQGFSAYINKIVSHQEIGFVFVFAYFRSRV